MAIMRCSPSQSSNLAGGVEIVADDVAGGIAQRLFVRRGGAGIRRVLGMGQADADDRRIDAVPQRDAVGDDRIGKQACAAFGRRADRAHG